MALTTTFVKKGVRSLDSYEGLSDVIACIDWEIQFTDGTSTANAVGETFLDLSGVSENFIPANQVDDATIESWIMDDLGLDYQSMLEHNTEVLGRMTKKANMTVIYEASE